MRKITQYLQIAVLLCILMILSMQAFTQTAVAPDVGDGSENNPYQIVTLENLYWLTQSDTVWDKHFIQTTDIDASATIEWDDSSGFTPIGNILTIGFTGSYNGKGHLINFININRPNEDNIGMFGHIDSGAHIDSLGLTNLNINGDRWVGGLTGGLNSGLVTNCYTTGSLNADSRAGGLLGYNGGEIHFCYSTVNVNSAYISAGGFVGFNQSEITHSYSTGDVISNGDEVGGFVGSNDYDGIIEDSYSTGNVSGNRYVGGFVGEQCLNGRIKGSYSTGNVSGNSYFGGLVGANFADTVNVESCFWDIEVSGQNISDGGTGLTTIEMQDINTYLSVGWDFMDEIYNGTDESWGINSAENNGYPFLKWQGYLNTAECQAPLSPVGKIVLGDISGNSITIDSLLVPGYGTYGYAIYINSNDIWEVPVDGTEPVVDSVWQNTGQQCFYFGTSNNPLVTVTGLKPVTKYSIKVHAYNDCSGTEMYEQIGIRIGQNTTIVGDGNESDPYIIANLDDLEWLMRNDTKWNKHYIQTADIDASLTADWDNGNGFTPIGNATTEFIGNYNGNGYVIDQLYINRPIDSLIGFFGNVGSSAQIENLGLTNVNINGSKYVGGLAGYLYGGQIKNCYTTGACENNTSDTWWSAIGGLVGFNEGKISLSYSDVDVSSAYDMAGGLVGVNADFISSSYSMGSVNGNDYTGGLIGVNLDMVFHSYSRSNVNAIFYGGGLIGDNYGYTAYCFWDTETSSQSTSVGGTGLTTSEMQDVNTYSNAYWDFIGETINGTNDYWGLNSNENDGYPFLYWQGFTNTAIITNSNNYVDGAGIRIYPNPVSNILNIEFGDKNTQRLTMLDIMGKTLIDKTIDTETEHIDVSNFKPGIYLINIYKDKEVFIKKVIKK